MSQFSCTTTILSIKPSASRAIPLYHISDSRKPVALYDHRMRSDDSKLFSWMRISSGTKQVIKIMTTEKRHAKTALKRMDIMKLYEANTQEGNKKGLGISECQGERGNKSVWLWINWTSVRYGAEGIKVLSHEICRENFINENIAWRYFHIKKKKRKSNFTLF